VRGISVVDPGAVPGASTSLGKEPRRGRHRLDTRGKDSLFAVIH